MVNIRKSCTEGKGIATMFTGDSAQRRGLWLRRKLVTSQNAKPRDAFTQYSDQEQGADSARAGASQICGYCRDEKYNGDDVSHRFNGVWVVMRPNVQANRRAAPTLTRAKKPAGASGGSQGETFGFVLLLRGASARFG
jgi:hypothetical protein